MGNTIYSVIQKELENKGFKVELKEITKNGVKMLGFAMGDSNIRPTIYPDLVIESLEENNRPATPENIADEIAKIYKANCNPDFININTCIDKDFILSNIRVCLQRSSDENIVKKDSPFSGVECYLRVMNENMSYKITPDIVKIIGVSLSDLWETAVKNTAGDVKIQNIGDVLGFGGCFPLWVVSNTFRNYGASAVLGITKDLVKSVIGQDLDNLVIIPSSVHECLIVTDESILHSDLVSMVKEVNASEVDPQDQLADDIFTLPL